MKTGVHGSVLMCHAPIVIPAIAGDRAEDCHRTTTAMREAARAVLAPKPEVLVVLSPHTPRYSRSYGLVTGERLRGNFGSFGHSEIKIDLPNARMESERLVRLSREEDLPLRFHEDEIVLDHGAMVPLHFLQEAGWSGPTLILGFPTHSSEILNERLGTLIRRTALAGQVRWGLVASGDMSHRLKHGAPAGYHPGAQRFDDEFVQHLAAGRYREISKIDGGLRDMAAEDVVDSFEIAAAVFEHNPQGHRVLSYEGPFGVGYCVAILSGEPA